MLNQFKLYMIGIGSAILAVFIFIFNKRGRDLKQLKKEVEINKIEKVLIKQKEKVNNAEKKTEDAVNDYNDFINKHNKLKDELGKLPN